MNSINDSDAIEVYESALPGYEILPFTGTWESTDALHCRIKGIPDLSFFSIKLKGPFRMTVLFFLCYFYLSHANETMTLLEK